jgi:hypothetical protein
MVLYIRSCVAPAHEIEALAGKQDLIWIIRICVKLKAGDGIIHDLQL